MRNVLEIRCRFCPVMTVGPASGLLLARYKRHLRNCGAARRVAVERGIPLDEVIADTLMRSGCEDGRLPNMTDLGRVSGANEAFAKALATEAARPNPFLEAIR